VNEDLFDRQTSDLLAFLKRLTAPMPEGFAKAPTLPAAAFLPAPSGDASN
jgi:hypothetical protein